MTCPICGMPPIPPTQMRPGYLPICYNGHTLKRPFGPSPPPLAEEKIRTRHQGKREPDLERGKLIRWRAEQLGISLSKHGNPFHGKTRPFCEECLKEHEGDCMTWRIKKRIQEIKKEISQLKKELKEKNERLK